MTQARDVGTAVPDDTSWVIPLGVGVDHAVSDRVNLTTTFWLNFTDLDTRSGTANVIQGSDSASAFNGGDGLVRADQVIE